MGNELKVEWISSDDKLRKEFEEFDRAMTKVLLGEAQSFYLREVSYEKGEDKTNGR